MFSRTNQALAFVLSLLIIFSVGTMTGCGSKSVNEEVSSTTATLSLNASPGSVTKGQTAIIDATLLDNGTAVPNQVVTFSVVPAGAGSFTPAADTTDAAGTVATVFTAITSGPATITATVAGSSVSKTAGITVTEVAQEGTGNLTISMTPSLLLANGVDTSRITVAVRDGAGQPAADGIIVKFVAGEKFDDIDGNGYWSAGIDTVIYDANANGQWDAIGLIPSTAVIAGGAGLASVDFIAGNNSGTVYIRATVDDNGITGNVEASVQLNPNATVNSIYLWNDSITIAVVHTGGIETGFAHALCLDEFGNPVPEGLQVQFLITSGPFVAGDSVMERIGNTGYGPYYALTNGQGIATAPVHSGSHSGTILLRATVGTVYSEATQIMVTSGPPAYLEVGAEVCNADYWDNVGEIVKMEAVVGDRYHNPVNDSTVVYFSTDEGTIVANIARTQDGEGKAYTDWFSGQTALPADGRIYIYAETAGGTVADTILFFNTHDLATITVPSPITAMRANGTDKATMTVYGYDLNSNPVIINTLFKASANHLSVPGGRLKDGCGFASANIEVTSGTLTEDLSTPGGNDDGIGAVDNVELYAEFGTASLIVPIQLLTSDANRNNSSMTVKPKAADYGDEVLVMVEIRDRWFNPLGDHSINASADNGGVFTPPTLRDTDPYGYVEFILTLPAAASGAEEVNITLDDTDPLGSGLTFRETITINTDPQLAVWPTALAYGTAGTNATFNISNNGTGTINWNLTATTAWITVNPTAGSTISGPDVVTVTVDRTGLASGDYTGTIDLVSDAGTKSVTVDMTVP